MGIDCIRFLLLRAYLVPTAAIPRGFHASAPKLRRMVSGCPPLRHIVLAWACNTTSALRLIGKPCLAYAELGRSLELGEFMPSGGVNLSFSLLLFRWQADAKPFRTEHHQAPSPASPIFRRTASACETQSSICVELQTRFHPVALGVLATGPLSCFASPG